MNRGQILARIADITEELHQISSAWARNTNDIQPIDLELYLSNINYLQEQAALLLKSFSAAEQQAATSAAVPSYNAFDGLHLKLSDINTTPPELMQESLAEHAANEELSLHEKLSEQVEKSNIASSLRSNIRTEQIHFSINEKLFIIRELFNADTNDFDRVMSHLNTLDSWEEVEFYLNATCVGPYKWDEKAAQREQMNAILRQRFPN